MTRKQLEQCLTFMAAYSADVLAEEIMERFGVLVTDHMSTEDALNAYLKFKEIKLESEGTNE